MQVREVMSQRPNILEADATIRDAAMRMRDDSIGLIPIAKNDKLVGMVTDRDITIRAIADGKSPEDKISEIISDEVLYCFESDDIESVLKNMHEQKVQRLIVLNNEQSKDLVGVVSVADIADKCKNDDRTAKAIAECCSHYH